MLVPMIILKYRFGGVDVFLDDLQLMNSMIKIPSKTRASTFNVGRERYN